MNDIVWVTGAYGFIGRHLSKLLNRQGYLVAGIGHGNWADFESKDSAAWGLSHWFESDVDYAGFENLLKISGPPKKIFHLAGGSSVGYSQKFPHLDFQRTAHSISSLLEWVRINSTDTSVVLASSAAVYGAGHQQPIKEDCDSTPFSPYGFHKRIAEMQLQSYSENFGLRTAAVRLFSVYGAGLRKQLLWELSNRINKETSTLELFGTGDEVRDFIHVEDAVRLLELAGRSANYQSPAFNGGTGIPRTVKEVAQELCNSRQQYIDLKFNGEQRPGDPLYLVADSQKAETIGFKPQIEFTSGIKSYSHWFLNNLDSNEQNQLLY